MARARAGLEKAVSDILQARGQDGKRMSLRQAERLTGLSPATIAELAKGNARTPDTVRRFALGLGEDARRLLTLAGFTSDEPFAGYDAPDANLSGASEYASASGAAAYPSAGYAPQEPLTGYAYQQATRSRTEWEQQDRPAPSPAPVLAPLDGPEVVLLARLEHALACLPPGPDRALWCSRLAHDVELMERWAQLADRTEEL